MEFLIEDPGFPEAEEGKFLPYVTAELGTGEDGKACFKKWVFL